VEWDMPLMIGFHGFNEFLKGILVGMDRGQHLICSISKIRGIWVAVHNK
jgi:hypothetical protein